MKKTAAAVIAAALVITLGGTTAFAFNHTGQTGQTGSQNTVDSSADISYNQYSDRTYCSETGHCYTGSGGSGHHAGHIYGHR